MKLDDISMNLDAINKYQESLYYHDQKEAALKGRLAQITVSVFDAVIEIGKFPLIAITCLALTALNLVGMFFSNECSLKHALGCIEDMLVCIARTPVAIILLPPKLLHQIFAIAISPQATESMAYYGSL